MLDNTEDLFLMFNQKGSISFDIEKKFIKKFKCHVERIRKLEMLFTRNKNFSRKLKVYLYGLYIYCIEVFLFSKDERLKNALVVYKSLYMNIAYLEGKSIDETWAEIIFHGKKTIKGSE